MICTEFQKQRMSLAEARRALGEMAEKIGLEHEEEVLQMIAAAEEEAADDDDSAP